MFRPGIGVASPSYSLSTPAMILRSVILPDPFKPSMSVFAPGKKDREMSLRMCRFGGTILPTRFMVKTYWAMGCWGDFLVGKGGLSTLAAPGVLSKGKGGTR